MIVLIVINEDGTEKRFGIGDNVQSVIRYVRDNNADRIVVGEVNEAGTVWEKIATFGTVMPKTFGGKRG